MTEKPKLSKGILYLVDAFNSQLSQFILCAAFWLAAIYVVCFTTFWIEPYYDVMKIGFLLWDIVADTFGFQHIEG